MRTLKFDIYGPYTLEQFKKDEDLVPTWPASVKLRENSYQVLFSGISISKIPYTKKKDLSMHLKILKLGLSFYFKKNTKLSKEEIECALMTVIRSK